MAALAWNLKSWLAMMMHLKTDRRKYVAMEFRGFVREMILLPCQVIRRARQTTCASSAGSRRPTGCSARGARSNGPASGSVATLPLRPFAALSVRVHGTAVAHSQNQWGKVPKVRFAHAISSLATCDMVRCAASKFALCQLAHPKLATRALLACFRVSVDRHTFEIPNVFGSGVLDRLVLPAGPLVGRRIVGVERRVRGRVIVHESL